MCEGQNKTYETPTTASPQSGFKPVDPDSQSGTLQPSHGPDITTSRYFYLPKLDVCSRVSEYQQNERDLISFFINVSRVT